MYFIALKNLTSGAETLATLRLDQTIPAENGCEAVEKRLSSRHRRSEQYINTAADQILTNEKTVSAPEDRITIDATRTPIVR